MFNMEFMNSYAKYATLLLEAEEVRPSMFGGGPDEGEVSRRNS